MRAALSLTLSLALGACAMVPGALSPTQSLDEGGEGVPRLALVGGDVMAVGPPGYCVDVVASNVSNGFAVMASCTLISDIPESPVIDGLVTVQLGAPGSAAITGAETALERLLRTDDGARLLSSEGRAQTVTLDAVVTRPGVVTVHFADSGSPVVYGVETLEWRAFLDLGDRLTTVAVRGFERAPLSRDEGLVLLEGAVAALRAANPEAAAAAR